MSSQARWQGDGRLGDPGSAKETHRRSLFFGGGGPYTVDELRDRAQMLDRLHAQIALTSEYEALLLRAFWTIHEEPESK
ncbi:MAG TPA: hypothetical protein VFS39_17655 [Nitrospira sp.]|nr:hypothetical protein [Nitrospira sp.]